MQNFPRLS